jgi:signal transduction histidine kinase
MFSEITQKNKLEILGKLTASLSHELRNPLSAIKLNLDYMKMSSDELSDDLVESLDSCIAGVQRIEYLIENILSFSRKSRNSNVFISINEVSDTAINLTSSKANKEKVRIKTDYCPTLPKIEFSESNLLQVFLNLLTNAIEACNEKGGEILIKSYLKDSINNQNVVWEIIDNGVGVKEEYKDKIFGEFFTNKESGTGIGLTVCRSLLEEKNAQLEFQSEFGKGTSFSILFNLAKGKEDVE